MKDNVIYLNEEDIISIGQSWEETVNVIEEAVCCLAAEDFAQPVKPYLRYRDMKNRIIAMPAFVGGNINTAGIKWIASFPDNINHNLPRAHSVVILNEADTGVPKAIINTPLVSIIRTASVTALMMKYYVNSKKPDEINLGIIGWGPIGQNHYKACKQLFGNKIKSVRLYDIRNINPDDKDITVCSSWEEVYDNSNIFITCTVSSQPYIDKKPPKGALLLNVSLRDFKPDIYEYVKDSLIVDDWEEVCRENTDIEVMHKQKGLKKEQTKSIIDVVKNNCLEDFSADAAVMFNPMGMAVFDIAIGNYYYEKAKALRSQSK